MECPYPALVVHCDWGSAPHKRQLTAAIYENDHFRILSPKPIYDPSKLLIELRNAVEPVDCILAGFDFPIGLPLAHAGLTGIDDFLSALPHFGKAVWRDFYLPASTPVEISPFRPFYPQKPGISRQVHLVNGLGLTSFNELRRLCEVREGSRPACPLFWTMGAQQVGKAAILGWSQVLVPALSSKDQHLAIWPFSGSLEELLRPGNTVAAETYPTEYYRQLGIKFTRTPGHRSGKRVQEARVCNAPALFRWATDNRVEIEPELIESIKIGFGPGLDGEDAFDSLIGLFGMLNVILGNQSEGQPPSNEIRKIEGWILGG